MQYKEAAWRVKADGTDDFLSALMSNIAGAAQSWDWFLLDIAGIATKNVLNRGVLDLEAAVAERPYGLHLKWHDVVDMNSAFTDFWSLLLIGVASPIAFSSREQMLESAEFVIERFDSGDWGVFCRRTDVCRSVVNMLTSYSVESQSWASFKAHCHSR
jgi:hypothetical protein